MTSSVGASPAQSHAWGSGVLLYPTRAVTSVLSQVPGSSVVRGAFDGVADAVSAVSPHTRRVAAYAGVGLLGVAGVVEWPVAAAGAAIVWLTQPLNRRDAGEATASPTRAGQATRTRRASARPSPAKSAPAKRTTAKRTTAKRTASSQKSAATTGTTAARATDRER